MKDLQASWRSFVANPPREPSPEAPREAQICAMCGVDRLHVTLLVSGAAGYVCSGCGPVVVRACAELDARGRTQCLAEPLVQWLETLDAMTRWADVVPILDAAMLLVGGDVQLADRIASEAFRFQHYARALAALELVPLHSCSMWNRLHRVFACLVLEDRARVADGLAVLDGLQTMAPAQRHLADIHRAWAASRFEAPGQPSFTMDRERMIEVVAEVRPTGPPMLLARALELLAALERTRDPTAALRHLDEASTLVEFPSMFLLRGDIEADRDLARARDAWERARSLAHPEGVWATRAASRLARSTSTP